MDNNELEDFCKLFSMTAWYYGKDKTRESAMIYWNALKSYPFDLVKECFEMQIRTSRFMPMVSDVIEAISKMDGRPEPQEAWAIVAASLKDEGVTVVRTEEMARAFGVALGLEHDAVAARMAFIEAYKIEVATSRAAGLPVKWEVSLGHDRHGRDGPLLAAVSDGRLTLEHVQPLLIGETATDDAMRLAGNKAQELEWKGERSHPPALFKSLVDKMTGKDKSQGGAGNDRAKP